MQFYAKKVSVAAASFKIERLNYNLVEVSFALTAAEFEDHRDNIWNEEVRVGA
jgi:hypothetical protein